MNANPIAEQRRQRKLENQRLEAEARRRQEELRLQREQEQQRIENERIAAEQQRLYELEQIRLKREAEAARIAAQEQAERRTIQSIEKKLSLVGAFCTSELTFPSDECLIPLCAAILTPSLLEKPIPSLETSVAFVADRNGRIHASHLAQRQRLFSFWLGKTNALLLPIAMQTTHFGHLIVCDQERQVLVLIDLVVVFQLFHHHSVAHHQKYCSFDATTAVLFVYGGHGNFVFVAPRGLAHDLTASELYVTDQLNHRIQVLSANLTPTPLTDPKTKAKPLRASVSKPAPVAPLLSFSRVFGQQGELKRPSGLDVSHYHVVVCDTGNSRLVVFTKRGLFVQSIGAKGHGPLEFMDLRDVQLMGVRKRALSRAVVPEEDVGITNEQFEIVVADLGNFRIQILNEKGEFLRQLSYLSGVEQVVFHRHVLNGLCVNLMRAFTGLKTPPPDLRGENMKDIYQLATKLHPSSSLYVEITSWQHQSRQDRARFHHPLALALAPVESELLVIDAENAKAFVYNADGSRLRWRHVHPMVQSVHSCVSLRLPNGHERWFLSDSSAHRIAAIDASSLALDFFVGAATYGDQVQCASGYLDGELHHPTFLATYDTNLVVSDTGNHSVVLFDAVSGAFVRRIGDGFGHRDGYLDSPQGLAIYQTQLMVADQRNHRVKVFDLTTFGFVRSFGGGELKFPTGLAVCGDLPTAPKCHFGSHRSAKVVVSDTGNARILVFSIAGIVQLVLNTTATPFDQTMVPMGVCCEPRSGYVLVCDVHNHCVVVFRNDGSYLTSFGATVEQENRLQRPMDVFLSESQQLIIADALKVDICTFDFY